MNTLPDINFKNIATFFDTEEIISATISQILKDFEMHGVCLHLNGNADHTYSGLLQQLSLQINGLLEHDNNRLWSILYQVDLSEKDIAKANVELVNYNHAEILAHLIIIRDLKKVLIRNYYKSYNSGHSDS